MKFKVDDWVRYKGVARINTITHTGYHLSNGYITDGTNGEMKLWKPEQGEYVSRKFGDNSFIVGMFGIDGFVGDVGYINVEPFIGELPSWIKDKQ